MSPSCVWAILSFMPAYINHSLLEDLFADVELVMDPDDRLAKIRLMTDVFVDLSVTSLERIAYERSRDGWTAPQIANEIGVSRLYIPAMIAAHAARTGLPILRRKSRSYDHAVDISRLVSREARVRAEGHPQS